MGLVKLICKYSCNNEYYLNSYLMIAVSLVCIVSLVCMATLLLLDKLISAFSTEPFAQSNFDFALFEQKTDTHGDCSNDEVFDIEHCIHIKRILAAMNCYQILDPHTNPTNADSFKHFCNAIYPEYLNDYEHMLSTHSHQSEAISDQLINYPQYGRCDHSKCKLFTRYNDDSFRKASVVAIEQSHMDSATLFLCELFDSIHHWLFHMFDAAMRIRGVDQDQLQILDDQCVDVQFHKIAAAIQTKSTKLKTHSDRFNKFKLSMTSSKIQATESNSTFTDSFIDHLHQSRASVVIINKIHKFLMNEQFDTDSIYHDLSEYRAGSNIINIVGNDEQCIISITDHIQEKQSMLPSFVR